MANIEDHFRKLYARYGVGQDMPVQEIGRASCRERV